MLRERVGVRIRPIEPDEYARLGALVLHAYTTLPGHVPDADYEAELYDVRTRAEAPGCEVLVAVSDDGDLLGGVTFVGDPTSPLAEHGVDGATSIRMLAVDDAARGAGIGNALVVACTDRSRALGAPAIVLHSTTYMVAAHRLYERLGFVREPSLDWHVDSGVDLIGFRLDL